MIAARESCAAQGLLWAAIRITANETVAGIRTRMSAASAVREPPHRGRESRSGASLQPSIMCARPANFLERESHIALLQERLSEAESLSKTPANERPDDRWLAATDCPRFQPPADSRTPDHDML